MQTQNFLTGIGATLLSLFGFALCLLPILRPSAKHGFTENLKRALITGIGFFTFAVSISVAIDYLLPSTVDKVWDMRALGSLSCFALPVTLLTIFGSFIWYSGRDAIR